MLEIVVAMGENKEIGINNKLPWNIKEEMAHFRKLTLNKTIIMGKNTFLSIGKALKDRQNIVLSTSLKNEYDDIIIEKNVDDCLKKYKDAIIIGGQKIFEQFLPFVDILSISYIKGSFEADTFFPDFEDDFEIIYEEDFEKFKYIKYKRK